MTSKRSALAAALVLGTWAAGPDAAALQMNLDRTALCELSDAVVFAEVGEIETVWSPQGEGRIERRAFLYVNEALHGTADSSLEVVLPGGKIGKQWHWVEDVPELKEGVQYALFLQRTPEGMTVIGGEAGALRVAPGGVGMGESIDSIKASLEVCNAK